MVYLFKYGHFARWLIICVYRMLDLRLIPPVNTFGRKIDRRKHLLTVNPFEEIRFEEFK